VLHKVFLQISARFEKHHYRNDGQLACNSTVSEQLLFNRFSSYKFLTATRREGVSRLRCLMGNIQYGFFKTYGMEIDDMRTVFSLCAFSLVPKENEPAVCLLRDWVHLPSA
jgi:hypothetical protein